MHTNVVVAGIEVAQIAISCTWHHMSQTPRHEPKHCCKRIAWTACISDHRLLTRPTIAGHQQEISQHLGAWQGNDCLCPTQNDGGMPLIAMQAAASNTHGIGMLNSRLQHWTRWHCIGTATEEAHLQASYPCSIRQHCCCLY